VAYELAGRVCVRDDIVGDTPRDTAEIRSALSAWAPTVAPVVKAAVSEQHGVVSWQACATQAHIARSTPSAPVGGEHHALENFNGVRPRIGLLTLGPNDPGTEFQDPDCYVRHLTPDGLRNIGGPGRAGAAADERARLFCIDHGGGR